MGYDEDRWAEEYARRLEPMSDENGYIIRRFALTPKERYEVQQIVKEQIQALFEELELPKLIGVDVGMDTKFWIPESLYQRAVEAGYFPPITKKE